MEIVSNSSKKHVTFVPGAVEASPLPQRFLVLCREASPGTKRLSEIFSPLGETEVILDREGYGGVWYPNEELSGFEGLMGEGFPPVTAWSRAIYHLASTLRDDEVVWFVEDDVAGSAHHFEALVRATAATGADLSAIHIRTRQEDPNWYYWHRADSRLGTPAAAFEPLCQMSARLINLALDYRKVRGHFVFHETLFASLACNAGLKCLDWSQDDRLSLLFSNFRYRPLVESAVPGIAHPVKDDLLHEAICRLLESPSSAASLPIDCLE